MKIAILSVRDFASRIGVTSERLYAMADNIKAHYRAMPLRDKKNGAVIRQLRIPDDELMGIQRKIVKHVLEPIGFSDLAHGGVRGRSPRTNAATHCGAALVVTVDVKHFFPSVSHRVVHGMFRDMGFGRDAANLITRLVTYRGYLPQGAASSTAIANLILKPVDELAGKLVSQADEAATRFVDDVATSGPQVVQHVGAIASELSHLGLSIHRGLSKSGRPKLRVMPNHKRQEVTGLVVNSKIGPSVAKSKRDEIRAQIHQLPKGPIEREKAIRSVLGRIEHVRQFNPGSAARLREQLNSALIL